MDDTDTNIEVDEVIWDVITYYADDIRSWRTQLKGRSLSHWRDMVYNYDKRLSEENINLIATKCWHLAEA